MIRLADSFRTFVRWRQCPFSATLSPRMLSISECAAVFFTKNSLPYTRSCCACSAVTLNSMPNAFHSMHIRLALSINRMDGANCECVCVIEVHTARLLYTLLSNFSISVSVRPSGLEAQQHAECESKCFYSLTMRMRCGDTLISQCYDDLWCRFSLRWISKHFFLCARFRVTLESDAHAIIMYSYSYPI